MKWIVFGIIGIFGIYWGFRGAYYDYHYGESNRKSEHLPPPSDREKKLVLWFIWLIYDFIFHVVGFLAGCACLYVLINRISADCHFQNLAFVDLILFIFSVLGLTGHLPQTLYGFVKAFGMLAREAAAKLTDNKQ